MHLSVDAEGWGEVPPEEAQATWKEEGTRSTANETPFIEVRMRSGHIVIIDLQDASLLDDPSWYVNRCGNIDYVHRRYQKPHGLHQVILGVDDGYEIDHINGSGLDNRRSNLRRATHAQNMANRPVSKSNKCGFKGVYWDSRWKKWRADIKKDGKTIHIGSYLTAEEAAVAYDATATSLFGEFARTNAQIRMSPDELIPRQGSTGDQQ
jgi:hypothetical protein